MSACRMAVAPFHSRSVWPALGGLHSAACTRWPALGAASAPLRRAVWRQACAGPRPARRRAAAVFAVNRKPPDRSGPSPPRPGPRAPHAPGGRDAPQEDPQLIIADCTSASAVLAAVSRFATNLTPLNTATAVHRLAKLSRSTAGHKCASPPFLADDRFAYLVARAERQLDSMSSRQVATVLWALAKLAFSPAPPFWAVAEKYIARELRRFSARGARDLRVLVRTDP